MEQFPNIIKDPDPHVTPTFIVDIIGQDEINTNNITKQQKQTVENTLERIDHAFKLRMECFDYVLNCWDDLDCEYINQINVGHAMKMVKELDQQFERSSLYLCEWFNRKSNEKKVIVLETSRLIFYGLKLFYDQLLFMMNHSHNGNPVTEKMFLDLFSALVRIFHLKIYDTTKTEHYFTIGEREFISEPDAIIYKFTESESCDAARLESSAFVVAKVTLSSLKVCDDFFDSKDSTATVKRNGGTVKYSKQCNILLKRGRRELIPVMLSMATLFKND